jgi:hypothetical protein
MTAGRWALVAGATAFALVYLLLGPKECVGVVDGSTFVKDCRTIAGFHVRLPYNSDPAPPNQESFHEGPTGLNRAPIILLGLAVGSVVTAGAYLVLRLSHGGLDELLIANDG